MRHLSKVILREIGTLDSVKEEYYVIFAERMIQHPAVQRVIPIFSALFSGEKKAIIIITNEIRRVCILECKKTGLSRFLNTKTIITLL